MSNQKLKLDALERGEYFICWPVSGENSSHGGCLSAQRLLVTTGEQRHRGVDERIEDGREGPAAMSDSSTMPDACMNTRLTPDD
jgi:hypothetical protein